MAACTLGPPYTRPVTLAGKGVNTTAAESRPSIPLRGEWWRAYNDPLLNHWVERLEAQNLDLQAAAERLVQLREQAVIGGARRWPELALGLDGSRGFAADALNPAERRYRSDIDLQAGVSWQVDLFGRLARAADAAGFSAQAGAAEYWALSQSLVAQLVERRAIIAILHRENAIQAGIVASRQRTLDTVRRRYEMGVLGNAAVDVHLARENLAAAEAELALLAQTWREQLLLVDVLLNQNPGTLLNSGQDFDDFPLLPLVEQRPPAQLSAALLDQRPDIRADEFRLMASQARVGVAMAELFPDISLSLSRGFDSDQWGGLLDNNNGFGLVAGRLSQTLFAGGRLRAGVRLSEAEVREHVARYSARVLQAMAEVERAMIQEDALVGRLGLLSQRLDSARKAERLAETRYQRGIGSLLGLLEVQRRRQGAERALLNAQREAWRARINLHLALGGDWFGTNAQSMFSQPQSKSTTATGGS